MYVPESHQFVLVMLHGYGMDWDDFGPHAASLGLPAALYFPRGPIEAASRGRCWWPVDEERRDRQLEIGPRDLFDSYPESRRSAGRRVAETIAAIRNRHPSMPLVLAGFSQGGMVACHMLLNESVEVDALILLSTSSIAIDDWRRALHRLRNLPVLICHGRADTDLSLDAGKRLRDILSDAGASVTWFEFEGGHEMALTVWRQMRKYLVQVIGPRVT